MTRFVCDLQRHSNGLVGGCIGCICFFFLPVSADSKRGRVALMTLPVALYYLPAVSSLLEDRTLRPAEMSVGKANTNNLITCSPIFLCYVSHSFNIGLCPFTTTTGTHATTTCRVPFVNRLDSCSHRLPRLFVTWEAQASMQVTVSTQSTLSELKRLLSKGWLVGLL